MRKYLCVRSHPNVTCESLKEIAKNAGLELENIEKIDFLGECKIRDFTGIGYMCPNLIQIHVGTPMQFKNYKPYSLENTEISCALRNILGPLMFHPNADHMDVYIKLRKSYIVSFILHFHHFFDIELVENLRATRDRANFVFPDCANNDWRYRPKFIIHLD